MVPMSPLFQGNYRTFLVQMPLSGTAVIESGGKCIESTPQMASLLSPEESTIMRWNSDNDQFMLRISRSLLKDP